MVNIHFKGKCAKDSFYVAKCGLLFIMWKKDLLGHYVVVTIHSFFRHVYSFPFGKTFTSKIFYIFLFRIYTKRWKCWDWILWNKKLLTYQTKLPGRCLGVGKFRGSKKIYKYSRHFGFDIPGKLRGTWHKGRNSAVLSSESSWTGQYKKSS